MAAKYHYSKAKYRYTEAKYHYTEERTDLLPPLHGHTNEQINSEPKVTGSKSH